MSTTETLTSTRSTASRDSKGTLRTLAGIIVDLGVTTSIFLFAHFGLKKLIPINNRGYVCGDSTLQYPNRPQTLPNLPFTIGTTILAVILVVAIESTSRRHHRKSFSRFYLGNQNIPQWVVEIYKHLGMLLLGALICYIIVAIGKRGIGRLRPYFFTVCKPQPSDGTDCSQPGNSFKLILSYSCQNKETSKKALDEMKLSFPSGHATFGCFFYFFLALFLQCRWIEKNLIILKLTVQGALVCFGVFVGLSRISDNQHHWSDVAAGMIIGTVVAFASILVIDDLFEHRRNDISFHTRSSI